MTDEDQWLDGMLERLSEVDARLTPEYLKRRFQELVEELVTDEEFEAAAQEAGVSLKTWYNTYVEECKDKGKIPTALEFAYWLPFAYGFQEGIEFAESFGGSIVALVETASQAEVLNYSCDFCNAEPHEGCTNPAGKPLDRALFHLARYNTACEPDDNLQEEKNA